MTAIELNNSVIRQVLSSNLIGYWRLNGNLTDSSASGYNLTATGTPGDTTGVFGGAKSFVIATSYASITNASGGNLNITGNKISIAGWVKPTNTGAGWQYLCSKRDGANTGYYLALENGTAARMFVASGAAGGVATGTTTLSNNNWYHIVGTYDGTTVRVYVNGKHDGSSAFTGNIASASTVPFYLALNSFNTAEGFTGELDDFAVFNTVLTPDQVKELYEGRTVGELWPQNGLVGLWHLNGNSTDFSGNNNHGTDTSITYSTANGKFGQGAGFNGTSSKIVIPDVSINGLKIAGSQTWGAWIYPTSNSAVGRTIIGRATTNASQILRLDYNTGAIAGKSDVQFQITGLTPNSSGVSSDLSLNKWHSVIGVYDGTQLKLYINGALVNSASVTGTPHNPTSQFGIGVLGDYTSFNYFAGNIDEVFIYSRALTSQEIRNYYAWASGRFTKTI